MNDMNELTGARWRKSSRSGNNGCVEVADNVTGVVGVRDSKDLPGPTLSFRPVAWVAFVAGVKSDHFGR